jgi:hypothetical protein
MQELKKGLHLLPGRHLSKVQRQLIIWRQKSPPR